MKIFLSYGRRSLEHARNLTEDLLALNNSVWFDRKLSGGQVWWDQILAEIRGCDVLVFLLDPSSVESVACRSEFGYAAALGKPILPILIADDVQLKLLPHEISRIQFVDYRKRDHASAMALARALSAIPLAPPLPDPLPAAPSMPLSYLGSLTLQIDSLSSLSYEAQSALLLDLRRSLRDPESKADVLTLLAKLRARPDLYAAIADETDDLLNLDPKKRHRTQAQANAKKTDAEAVSTDDLASSQDDELALKLSGCGCVVAPVVSAIGVALIASKDDSGMIAGVAIAAVGTWLGRASWNRL